MNRGQRQTAEFSAVGQFERNHPSGANAPDFWRLLRHG